MNQVQSKISTEIQSEKKLSNNESIKTNDTLTTKKIKIERKKFDKTVCFF